MADTDFDAVAGSLNNKIVNVTSNSSGVTVSSSPWTKIGKTIVGNLYLEKSGGFTAESWITNVARIDSNYPPTLQMFAACSGSGLSGLVRVNTDGSIDIYIKSSVSGSVVSTICYRVNS